jgi:hypothetical protein
MLTILPLNEVKARVEVRDVGTAHPYPGNSV